MLVYLACPYTHKMESVRQARVTMACAVAARLMELNTAVFSPITHGNAIAGFLPEARLHDHEFWMQQCLPILAASQKLVLLPIEGWKESRGVEHELAYAKARGIPCYVWQGFSAYSGVDATLLTDDIMSEYGLTPIGESHVA